MLKKAKHAQVNNVNTSNSCLIGIIAGLILVVIAFSLIKPMKTNGVSMEPTLLDGEITIMSRHAYRNNNFERGDIIVFKYDAENKNFVKRIVGLPNETVTIDNGKVYIDGKELKENYIDSSIIKTYTDKQGAAKYTVPEGKLFVMGDNRECSRDSRDKSVGFVEFDDIKGKIIMGIAEGHIEKF